MPELAGSFKLFLKASLAIASWTAPSLPEDTNKKITLINAEIDAFLWATRLPVGRFPTPRVRLYSSYGRKSPD